jgi:hypothetical protein
VSRINEIRARLQLVADGKTEIDPFDYHADVRVLLAEIDRLTAAANPTVATGPDSLWTLPDGRIVRASQSTVPASIPGHSGGVGGPAMTPVYGALPAPNSPTGTDTQEDAP